MVSACPQIKGLAFQMGNVLQSNHGTRENDDRQTTGNRGTDLAHLIMKKSFDDSVNLQDTGHILRFLFLTLTTNSLPASYSNPLFSVCECSFSCSQAHGIALWPSAPSQQQSAEMVSVVALLSTTFEQSLFVKCGCSGARVTWHDW